MPNRTGTLHCRLTVVLITERCRPARLDLRYDPDEGYAVGLRIRAGLEEREAVPGDLRLSRDLLAAGLATATGAGAVRVRPLSEEWTLVELHTPEGRTVLVVGAADLRAFLAETYRLVPAGTEGCRVDWDAELRSLGA